MKNRFLLFGKLVVVLASAVVFCFMLVQTALAALEGPTLIPPHGLEFVDSDPGDEDNKEQWGRAVGRDFTFTVRDVSAYDQLLWRPLAAALAFDGAVDVAGETLVLANGSGTTVNYAGQADVERLNENAGVYETVAVTTEFVLTAKDEGDSPISFQLVNGEPTVDLKALTPNANDEVVFTAHLAFRAQMPTYQTTTPLCTLSPDPIAGEWYGALDVYDCLHTDPNNDRPAMTTFDHGFFYEIPSLTLLEHDAHMEQLVGDVQSTTSETKSLVEFLYEDWLDFLKPALGQLGQELNELKNQMVLLEGAISDLGGRFDDLFVRFDQQDAAMHGRFDQQAARLSDLESQINNLPQIWLMLYLFGLEELIPPEMELPAEVPDLDEIVHLSQWYQAIAAVDEKVGSLQAAVGESTELDIQVKDFGSVPGGSKQSGAVKRFAVLIQVNGVPQEGAAITTITAIVDGGDMSLVPIAEFTVIEIGGGLYDVHVPLAQSLSGEKVFLIQASLTENSHTIYGSQLFTVGQHTE